MRKRTIAAMVALVLLVLPAGLLVTSTRSFALMLERERTRTLNEEAAIARALVMEIGDGGYEMTWQAAQSAQRRYGSDTLRVMLLWYGEPMAGAVVPKEARILLDSAPERATRLDKEAQTLCVAHALSSRVMLLLVSDVSPVYALRNRLQMMTAMLCAVGAGISAGAAVLLSRLVTRPVRTLAKAARALAAGDGKAQLPPSSADEIGELTQAFSAMMEAVQSRESNLREQAERQAAFSDAMAHEMRTPLTAIVAGSRLLQQAKLPEEARATLLDTMTREAQRLSDMDKQLLMLTRLHHDTPEMTVFSLREMAEEALAVFDAVQLSGEDGCTKGERELHIILVRNLVVNACRAGGETPVRVIIHHDGLTVSDAGCGMTAEQVAQATQPFWRADSARTRRAGGTGLGLALCAEIARLHGGTLKIESCPGQGTQVTYRCGAEFTTC